MFFRPNYFHGFLLGLMLAFFMNKGVSAKNGTTTTATLPISKPTLSLTTAATSMPKNSSVDSSLPNNSSATTTTATFLYAVNKNGTDDDSSPWESEEPEEFLETINNGTLIKGAKVQGVKSQWNTHVGDDEAEATE